MEINLPFGIQLIIPQIANLKFENPFSIAPGHETEVILVAGVAALVLAYVKLSGSKHEGSSEQSKAPAIDTSVNDVLGLPFGLTNKGMDFGKRTGLYALQDGFTRFLDKHIGGLESDD